MSVFARMVFAQQRRLALSTGPLHRLSPLSVSQVARGASVFSPAAMSSSLLRTQSSSYAWYSTPSGPDYDVYQLLTLAAQGDVAGLKKLLRSGVSVNASGYDSRTALHLAASEGKLEAVQFLVERGANVNAMDRFGGTPLHDALEARRSEIAKYLRSNGSTLGDRRDLLVGKVLQASAAGNVEVLENVFQNSFLSISECQDYDRRSALHLAASNNHLEAVRYLLEKGADPNARDRFGFTPVQEALREGLQDIANLITNFQRTPHTEEEKEVVLEQERLREHYNGVKALLLKHKLYSEKLILSELDWYYYNLGFPSFYFNRFPPEQAYRHVEAYIAAKQVAFANGTSEDIRIDGVETGGGTVFICPNDKESNIRVEEAVQNLSEKWTNEEPGTHVSIFHFKSSGSAIPHGTSQLSLFIVDKSKVPEGESVSYQETDLRKIAGPNFSTWRKPAAVAQFEEIIRTATTKISPVFQILPKRDGLCHVMYAHSRDSYPLAMHKTSQILEANGISTVRKIVEQFANGLTVYSMYFQQLPEEKIRSALNDLSLMFIARRSNELLPLMFNNTLSTKEYAFCGAVSMYVYYFLSHRDEDLEYLLNALKDDQVRLPHLENIRRSLRHEAVSLARITQTMATYPDVIREIVAIFEKKFDYTGDSSGWEDAIPKLREKIAKVAENDQDEEILEYMLSFNEVCVKTNFFKVPKTSISFRLDPKAVKLEKTYPVTPFGIFLFVGNDFHGFHVRFNDIARGGLRLVLSRDKASFSRNLETAFFENYNLAHTQNRKNKDIPEFGSKGVMLLHPRPADKMKFAGEQVFRKYISSMLDLLIPSEEVKDHYQKPEIIFCGPDENTADLMEWACLYSKRRGYPYWKAYTTGKPQSLGGIPHDLYGMTTNSVHQFVLEALHDHGLQEENVSKLQTGGPDGDLGSNEILISKDKTIGVVDGSGVICDPDGIDREELVRLAKGRKMVEHFDQSKLSRSGFKVLCNQNDVVLPDGTLVPSGLHFRNEFHLTPYSSADLFVPCGGRPESVNSKNVHRLFHADGTPRFKFIIEGANLFFTQEARSTLESRGVVLFKDASSNKGGVTSSSLEVLAALALTDEEHSKHMTFQPGQPAPAFYRQYVEEVQRRIRENAKNEYHCLVKEHQRTGQHRHLLTDALSDKINQLHKAIAESPLLTSEKLRKKVMGEAIPIQLQELVPGGLDTILSRLPENYIQTLFCKHLASNFVYKYGLNAGEFGFFEFMDHYISEPGMSILAGAASSSSSSHGKRSKKN